MQNENKFFGSLFKPQRVIPRVRLKFSTWKGNRRNKSKDREAEPYFGVSYKTEDVEAHLVPSHGTKNIQISAATPTEYPQLHTFQRKPNTSAVSRQGKQKPTDDVGSCSKNHVPVDCQTESNDNDKCFTHTSTTNWLVTQNEEREPTPIILRGKTTDSWDDAMQEIKHSKQTGDQKNGVELLLEVNQYIKDTFMWLDYQKKGYVPYSAVKILCQLLNKSCPHFDDTCNAVSEIDKCNDKFCKQHLRFEKFSFILRHCFEKEEMLLPNLSQRQSAFPLSGVPRRLELLKNIITSINKLDSYRKFWTYSEDSNARNCLHRDAFQNSNISIISREVELKRRILFQQQEINGLREIIEGLRIALQSSDAENLCLHVILQSEEKPSSHLQSFRAGQDHTDRPADMQRSYSCESLESGFQTSFESVSRLKPDHEMSNERFTDSDYQNLSKDDDIDYLRRKLRKAYSKIHRANRDLESLRFMVINNKKDKERIQELQSQINDLRDQMRDKDLLLNTTKRECSSLKHSRSRMVSELLKVRSVISELCFRAKKQDGKRENDIAESFAMTSLSYGSSTDSLDRYSETCLENVGCSNLELNKLRGSSSDSSSTLNLSGRSEDEGEYIVSFEAEPRFLPKPRRQHPKMPARNFPYSIPKGRKTSPSTGNTVGTNDYGSETYTDGLSYYKNASQSESKRILDDLEEEMKQLQFNLDNGKW